MIDNNQLKNKIEEVANSYDLELDSIEKIEKISNKYYNIDFVLKQKYKIPFTNIVVNIKMTFNWMINIKDNIVEIKPIKNHNIPFFKAHFENPNDPEILKLLKTIRLFFSLSYNKIISDKIDFISLANQLDDRSSFQNVLDYFKNNNSFQKKMINIIKEFYKNFPNAFNNLKADYRNSKLFTFHLFPHISSILEKKKDKVKIYIDSPCFNDRQHLFYHEENTSKENIMQGIENMLHFSISTTIDLQNTVYLNDSYGFNATYKYILLYIFNKLNLDL